MERVQNAAARLITKTRKREHITPVLKYWLPVHLRVRYKTIYQTRKLVHGNGSAPTYLRELVRSANRSRATRTPRGPSFDRGLNYL
jgi:hypothetical protein